MEGEGGGGIVVEGGYGGEGRRKEDTTAWPTSFDWDPEQLKVYCGSSDDVYAKILFVSAHPTSSSCLPLTLSQADGGQ
jgi:hypothetical protein